MNYRIIKDKVDITHIPESNVLGKIEKIKESIIEHGWEPDFGDLSYHGDN